MRRVLSETEWKAANLMDPTSSWLFAAWLVFFFGACLIVACCGAVALSGRTFRRNTLSSLARVLLGIGSILGFASLIVGILIWVDWKNSYPYTTKDVCEKVEIERAFQWSEIEVGDRVVVTVQCIATDDESNQVKVVVDD